MSGADTPAVTQQAIVLALFARHPQGITSMDAIRAAGITRLAARVRELREAGHYIASTWEQQGSKRYVRYQYVPLSESESRLMDGNR